MRTLFVAAIFGLLVTSCANNDWLTTDDVEVISESTSPDGKHIATVFFCSGGGAAGYTYTNVNLRKASDAFSQRDFLLGEHLWHSYAGISVAWKDSSHLDVSYKWSSDLPEYKKENGQRVPEKDGVNVNYILLGK